jgi:hypothetical protein
MDVLSSEVVCWQLEVSLARELAPEGSIDLSQRSEHEVGVRWLSACEDVSPE